MRKASFGSWEDRRKNKVLKCRVLKMPLLAGPPPLPLPVDSTGLHGGPSQLSLGRPVHTDPSSPGESTCLPVTASLSPTTSFPWPFLTSAAREAPSVVFSYILLFACTGLSTISKYGLICLCTDIFILMIMSPIVFPFLDIGDTAFRSYSALRPNRTPGIS